MFALRSDLQNYADGRLPAARATHSGKISKDLPLKILVSQVGVWGVALTSTYLYKFKLRKSQRQRDAKYCNS
jgi:hypothetical protein